MRKACLLIRRFVPVVLLLCVMLFGMGQSGGGCATTMNDLNAVNYGIMSQDPSYTPQQRRAFSAISQFSAIQARREHERDVADRMRSEVNVNVNEPQTYTTSRSSSQQHHPHVVQLADGKCRPEAGWTWVTQTDGDFRVKPVNTDMTADGQFHPVAGYTWVNPSDPNDFRTKKKETPQATLWETYRKAAIEAHNAERYAEAEELFKAAIPEAEKVGKDSPALAMTLFWLGLTCRAQDKTAEAEALFKRALPMLEGEDRFRRETAGILFNLARIESARENNATARALCTRAVDLHKQAEDRNDMELSGQLNFLGVMHVSQDDHKSAIAAFTESLALDPNDAAVYQNRAHAKTEVGDFSGAKQDYIKYAELAKDSARAANDIAWRFSTSADEQIRDGRKAVALAEQAVSATGRKDAAYLDTLAAALAEAGRFAEAVEVQKEAIGLLSDQEHIADFTARLRLYEDGKPYHRGK